MRNPHRRSALSVAAAVGASLLLVLSGCGNGGSTGTTPPSQAQSGQTAGGDGGSAAAATSAANDGIQAPPESATSAPAKAGAACAGNPNLPKGALPQGCAKAPKGAKRLAASTVIMTPTKNIWCNADAYGLDCSMMGPNVRYDLKPTGKAFVPNRDDGPAGTKPVIVKHGTTAVMGAYACSSQTVGLACWSTKSGHGLFLSKAKQLRW